MRFVTVGDTALTVRPGPDAGLFPADLAGALRSASLPGVVDVLTAFDAITIIYDADRMPPDPGGPIGVLTAWVRTIAGRPADLSHTPVGRLFELPVHYGSDGGPDLQSFATVVGLSPADLIALHASGLYTVAAVGFLPGFAYLTGLPDRLIVPRRQTPRVRVPAGSVAVGGPYTGVYPVASPGGWHLLGRTDHTLFDPTDPAATPFRVGDRVRFVPTAKGRP